MKITSYKDVLALVVLIGGIVLPVTGFVLYFTDRGSPLIFESIGIAVALLFWILAWLGLGVLGIIRHIGTAMIIASGVCLIRKPMAGMGCLLIGLAFRYFVFWMTRKHHSHPHESSSPKIF